MSRHTLIKDWQEDLQLTITLKVNHNRIRSMTLKLTSIKKGDPKNPALVFMHYLGGSAQTWLPVIELLQQDYYCIALDMPGFGHSAELAPQNIETQAKWVRETLNEMDVVSPWLIGHSMTGKLAAVMALQQPQQVAGIVLTAPSPLCPQPMTDEQFTAQRDWQPTEQNARNFVAGSHQKPLLLEVEQRTVDDVLRANPAAFTYWAETASQEDFEHRYPDAPVPALLLLGTEDGNVPGLDQQMATTLNHFTPHYYQLIEGCGHLLPLEAPDTVADAISRFVQESRG